MSDSQYSSKWRKSLHEIIFEADTPAGKLFDIALLWMILLSVLAVMLESVESIKNLYGAHLRIAEWAFTVIFTIEYICRILAVNKPLKYARSFFGTIDLLAVIPTYLSLFITGTQALIVIRAVRLLRVFRVLKLARYLTEANMLKTAIHASQHKITVFLGAVFTVVIIVGSVMYLIEGPTSGFTSIPRSMYWAIVTMTTVGYGDITPQTPLGQTLSAILMVFGYGLIAVPTGIVSVEIAKVSSADDISTQACPDCSKSGHAIDAKFCKYCSARI